MLLLAIPQGLVVSPTPAHTLPAETRRQWRKGTPAAISRCSPVRILSTAALVVVCLVLLPLALVESWALGAFRG